MSYLSEPNYSLDENLIDFNSAFFFEFHNFDDYELPKIDIDNHNNNNNTKETTEYNGNKNKNFELKKKVGRKPMKNKQEGQKENKNIHTKDYKDNITRKIQVHFLNFLILFINEILINYGFEKKFLKIDYKNKKNVNKKSIENLKKKEIGQILCQDITTKYRKLYKIDKEINKKLYLEVIKYDSIKKILSETYINIFRNIYYVNKREINDYDLNIKLSNNVKTYKDLLEENKEDSEYIEKMNKVVEEYYLPKKIFSQH